MLGIGTKKRVLRKPPNARFVSTGPSAYERFLTVFFRRFDLYQHFYGSFVLHMISLFFLKNAIRITNTNFHPKKDVTKLFKGVLWKERVHSK